MCPPSLSLARSVCLSFSVLCVAHVRLFGLVAELVSSCGRLRDGLRATWRGWQSERRQRGDVKLMKQREIWTACLSTAPPPPPPPPHLKLPTLHPHPPPPTPTPFTECERCFFGLVFFYFFVLFSSIMKVFVIPKLQSCRVFFCCVFFPFLF